MLFDQFGQPIDTFMERIQLVTHHTENSVCDRGQFKTLFRTVLSRELGHSFDARG